MKKSKKLCDITVIIITYNEDNHLKRCIDSLKKYVQNVFILDSYSTDKTVNIIKSKRIKFKSKQFKNHSDQFNSAIKLSKAKTKWLMRIDADEYVEKKFFEKLNKKLSQINNNVNGINITRRYFFNKKEIRYGGVFPQKKLRIWKNGKGFCEKTFFDEEIICEPKIINLDLSIFDNNKNTFKSWKKKHRIYAVKEAIRFKLEKNLNNKNLSNEQRKIKIINKNIYYRFPIFLRAIFLFFYRYFFNLGFKDGVNGLKFCFWHTLWFRLLVDLNIFKIFLIYKKKKDTIENMFKRLTNDISN
jgi:glycosyltransferase involved in cell wall biosynthesis